MTAHNAAAWLVDRHVEAGDGERTAYLVEGTATTYAQLQRELWRAQNALRALDVRRGERVALLLDDELAFPAWFLGGMRSGVIPVPLSTMLTPPEVAAIVADAEAGVAVLSAGYEGHLDTIAGAAPDLRAGVVIAGEVGAHDLPVEPWSRFDDDTEAPVAATRADSPAFWLYSSGTTGVPKGVMHRHGSPRATAETYARSVLEIGPDDRTLSVAKLFFAYGLGNGLYFPMSVGAQGVLYPHRPTPETMFEVIDRHRPTLFFGVPTLFGSMLQVKDAEKRFDLSSLRACVSAGEALPDEIYTRWRERFGVEILDGIGTTEILHIFLSNRAGQSRPGSSGQPVPGYDAVVVDDDGHPLPPGEIGNLRVRGDSTMAYYWNQHEKTKQTLLGEWIQTGDKYSVDADGYYWYCGRADDMLKVGGIWVSPVEVEATLIRHPAVLEAAVVGQEDSEGLVKPKAYIVLKDTATGSAGLEDELKAFVKDKIAHYKYPRWIEFVAELPKTATGKIQRFKLRQPA
jgi:benzoate-CoA ligase family protein